MFQVLSVRQRAKLMTKMEACLYVFVDRYNMEVRLANRANHTQNVKEALLGNNMTAS